MAAKQAAAGVEGVQLHGNMGWRTGVSSEGDFDRWHWTWMDTDGCAGIHGARPESR